MTPDIEIIKRETADPVRYRNSIIDEMPNWKIRASVQDILRDYMDDIRATARAIEVVADRLAGGVK